MPIIHLIEEPEYKVGVWKIGETAEEMQQMLQLDKDEMQFLESLKSGKRYLHWLSSRVMLRKLLQTDNFIQLDADATGKPMLKNFPHRISISHSEDMAAVIISQKYEVGIDIERIKEKVKRVQERFLSEKELQNIDPQYETQHLIQCWCAKEALFKLYARGNVDFRQQLVLRNYEYKKDGRIEGTILKDDLTATFTIHSKELEDYIIAYVVGSEVEE